MSMFAGYSVNLDPRGELSGRPTMDVRIDISNPPPDSDIEKTGNEFLRVLAEFVQYKVGSNSNLAFPIAISPVRAAYIDGVGLVTFAYFGKKPVLPDQVATTQEIAKFSQTVLHIEAPEWGVADVALAGIDAGKNIISAPGEFAADVAENTKAAIGKISGITDAISKAAGSSIGNIFTPETTIKIVAIASAVFLVYTLSRRK